MDVSRCLFLKWRSKSDPIVMLDFVSVNCKCRPVSCDVFRAAVKWTRRCVRACDFVWVYECMFVFVCDFGY